MKKIIIGVHGLGNKPPRDILKKWWMKSIDDGLNAIGVPAMLYDFELVYWADYMYEKPLDPKVKDKKNPLYIKRPYVPAECLPEKFKSSKLRKKILDKIDKRLDKMFYEEHRFINYDTFADMLIRRLYKDLDIYYHKNCIRKSQKEISAKEAIRLELARTLKKHKNKDILFISHSMGTIVAYDALTQVIPEVKINTFITMGSPLGIPVIVKKILQEQNRDYRIDNKAHAPENILKKWYNFSDLRDKIAVNYALGDDFKNNSRLIGPVDMVVRNTYEYDGKKHPHKVYGYFRTPEVAQTICEFLSYKRFDLLEKFGKILRKLVNSH